MLVKIRLCFRLLPLGFGFDLRFFFLIPGGALLVLYRRRGLCIEHRGFDALRLIITSLVRRLDLTHHSLVSMVAAKQSGNGRKDREQCGA